MLVRIRKEMSEQLLRLWSRRLAPALSLLAICLGYLLPRHYPMLSAEVLILLAGALAFGAGIGYACERMSERGVALVSGALIIGSAIYIFNAFNLLAPIDGNDIPDKSVRYAFKFFIIFIVPIGFALLMRRDISLILSFGMTVFIVGILVAPNSEVLTWGNNSPSPEPPRRLVLHIIFDEFTGNSGIGPTFPGGAQLRNDISTFFVQRRFRLYEGAFSTYAYTTQSLPALFSFTHPMPKDISRHSYAWFETLQRSGYRVHYFGTELVPLCNDPGNAAHLQGCILQPLSKLKYIHDYHESAWQKASDILLSALGNIPYLHKLMNLYQIGSESEQNDRLKFLANVRTTLSREGGDLAFVVHVLLPHSTMVYDENCTLHPNQAFQSDVSRHGEERQAFQRAYSGQMRCALKQLDSLLQVVDRRWPNSTVIVQGDHGLRLKPFIADREDIRMRHAALFAVRANGVAPGIVPQEHNLQMLFARYAGGRTISDSRVLYDDNKWDKNQARVLPQ
jgi:hypothetical protein